MKKNILLVLIITTLFTLCACNDTATFEEGTLLYDCGITSMDDIDSCTLLYDETGEMEITNMEDLIPLSKYEYKEVCPSETLPQLLLFPKTKWINISFNGEDQRFLVMEDGIIGVASAEGVGFLLYEAPAEHRLTPSKMEKLYEKYK